jgi:hypothetical protein
MTADRLLVQHKLEGMARRLKQLRERSENVLQHVAEMRYWFEDEAPDDVPAVQEALEITRAAIVAVQIDLESTIFSLESAQLRAKRTARLVAAHGISSCLRWCDEVEAMEQGQPSHAVREELAKTRAALVAVQIDVESTIFALESAQLRATRTARLMAGRASSLTGAAYEAQ